MRLTPPPMERFFFRPVFLARLFFVLLTTWLASRIAVQTARDPRVFSAIAFVAALIIVIIEYATNAIASRKILLAAFGWLMGMLFAQLFYRTIPEAILPTSTSLFICNILFGYFGIILGLRHADWILRPGNLKFFLVNPRERPKILDSSVIIDGRILDVLRLEVLSGPVMVPNFVLREIQGIADSADPYRRARGRRGLEVLNRLNTECKSFDVIDTDFPDLTEVDEKLIQLCMTMNADLVTNDFNLHKIAQVRLIRVINLNELAEALRPAVFVGETIDLPIVKAGKEAGQGVSYLKDGTMVVIEGGEEFIGQECEIVVSNILQNASGRLVFARLIEAPAREETLAPRTPGTAPVRPRLPTAAH